MKTILRYLKPRALIMSVQLTVKFIGTVIELLLPWMLAKILDDAAPLKDRGQVLFWGGLMVVTAAAALLANCTANRMSTRISADITKQLRLDLFRRTAYLSAAETDGFTTPSLISRLTSDTYNVHQMVDRMQRLGVRAPILLLGGICVTLAMEPVLALVLIATLPLLGAVVYIVSKRGIPLYTGTQQKLDDLVRKVQENMTGVRVVKALSKGEYERQRFDDINAAAADSEKQAGVWMAVTNPVMNFVFNAGLAIVIVVGAFRVRGGDTQPGVIIAFLSYFGIMLNSVMMISRMFVMFSKGIASGKRIGEVLDCEEGMPLAAAEPCKGCDAHIVFDHVSFSYNKIKNDLEDISFALRRGETLGVIGATGSGKSTLVQLLLRFYDPDAGAIYISARRVDTLPHEVLHRKFGVVFQNDFLFQASIRDNLCLGRDIEDEALLRAADAAQAAFIRERGLDYPLSVKGANLSGGQRQRLLIARALCGEAEILLLDDSSSALDYKTDAELRKALNRDFDGVTTVIVAQRISSILHADHILVLEDGRVVGSGRHEALLASCPYYRETYEVQMGGMAAGEGGAE